MPPDVVALPCAPTQLELGDLHAGLLGGVAVADGDGVVLERIEVNHYAGRRADFVLTTVAAPDGTGVVEVNVPEPTQSVSDLACQR